MKKCPCCGALLIGYNDMLCCEYCGYEEKDKSLVKNYNLLITHSQGTVNAIGIFIQDSGITCDLNANSTSSFMLAPGPHEITFRAGHRIEKRVVVTNDVGLIAKIDVSYDFMRNTPFVIKIDQPDTSSQYNTDLVNGKLPAQKTTLSLVALIMACWGLVIPAFIIALVNIKKAKKNELRPNAMDVCAFILSILFGSIWFLVLLMSMVAR